MTHFFFVFSNFAPNGFYYCSTMLLTTLDLKNNLPPFDHHEPTIQCFEGLLQQSLNLKQVTLTQMDRKREAKQDLPTGWSSFVDSGSGRTLYGNEGTGDVAFNLMDVYKKAAVLKVGGQVLEEPEGATPPKPAAKKRKTKTAKSVASSDTEHNIVTPSATKKKTPPPDIVYMM